MARGKRFEYSISLDEAGALLADGADELRPGPSWTPEHLVLAALARCSIASLAHHAGRRKLAVSATASASGVVERGPDGGRYAFTGMHVDVTARIDPAPAGEDLGELLGLAERDCFVGASLTCSPVYRWTVNGQGAGARPPHP